jgi:spore germination cell wall hydrolase CwlJ-like protein
MGPELGTEVMLRVSKLRTATIAVLQKWRAGMRRWWLAMSDTEQRETITRASLVAVCAVAATVSLPAIGMIQTQKRAEADYRADAMRLAQMLDGGAAVRAEAHAPEVLDSAWMRTVEYSLERDPGASLSRYAMRDRDGAALASLVHFNFDHLESAETIEAETHCMAQAVYYESAREPLEGQLAVAEVVANRIKDHRYPDTACDVVFQGATRTTGCQFTFTCDGALAIRPRGENWERAQRIAAHVMMGLNETRTGGATHYHATYVDPIWNAGLIHTSDIGLHIFYRFPRGAEWARVRQDFSNKLSDAQILEASAEADPALEALEIEGLDTELFEEETLIADADVVPVQPISAAPAQVVTSTRTVTASAPVYTTVRRTVVAPSENNSVSAETAALDAPAAAAGSL